MSRPTPIHTVPRTAVSHGRSEPGARTLAEEIAVAISYNGNTQAVMMASPSDLGDFALGFSLTEHIITDPAQIDRLEIVEHPNGIEARIWLHDGEAKALTSRRRHMAGPVGCGLCGIESLDEVLRPIVPVPATDLTLSHADVTHAMGELRGHQPLHDATRSVHAAGFWTPALGMVLTREDVGRHNALDKLIGAMATAGARGPTGAILLTSRISIELVQKCAVAGTAVLVAASAPTAHALRLAEAAGITLVALARDDRFEIFTHPRRIIAGDVVHVA